MREHGAGDQVIENEVGRRTAASGWNGEGGGVEDRCGEA